MLERFIGEAGRRNCVEALLKQKLVANNRDLAQALANCIEVSIIQAGDTIIEQHANDHSIYLILQGAFEITVYGRIVATCVTNDYVGEMTAVDPSLRRSATVKAKINSAVARFTEQYYLRLGERFPEINRCIAQELTKRLAQQNALLNPARKTFRVFIISSVAAVEIATVIQNSLSTENFITVVWTDGFFKEPHYSLQSLEYEADNSDFAIAIADAPGLSPASEADWSVHKDDLVFELNLFIERLAKERVILLESAQRNCDLPTSLAGITRIAYLYEQDKDVSQQLAPACRTLISYIHKQHNLCV
jgi:predicted nucleotide-binding protein